MPTKASGPGAWAAAPPGWVAPRASISSEHMETWVILGIAMTRTLRFVGV
jgi:hypothetical protein